MKRGLLVASLIVLSVTAYGYYAFSTDEFVPEIRTVDVRLGDVVDAVGATGALEAVTTVNVGSQVSGLIQDLLVDYNSIVRQNEVIMRLDPSLFETQTEQARANLVRAEADVEGLQVALEDSQMQLRRAEDLAGRELVPQTELEAAQVAVRSAAARLKSSQAAVIQAQASLNQNEVNLEHTVIRAPIDGIVISRLVDVGQTVAASLQAPELFVIAADLTKMRVIANIDESDVGRIRPEQRATFTVDAFPEEEFEGRVSQIRLEPVVTQNVVTYATVIDAPNPDLRLKPGMTATVTLEIARREDVLRIPNQALRFRPTPEMFLAINQPVPDAQRVGSRSPISAGSALSGRGSRPGPERGAETTDEGVGRNGPGRASGEMPPERRQQMRERFQQMSPADREAFIARRRAGRGERGGTGNGGDRASRRRLSNRVDTPNVPTVERGATTIDALFGPLPTTESLGQVWIMQDDRLEPVTVRLGVTDGTATQLLPPAGATREGSGADLTAGTQLVTNITTPDAGTAGLGAGGSPLIPQFGRRRR